MADVMVEREFKNMILGFKPGEQAIFHRKADFGIVPAALAIQFDGNIPVFENPGQGSV
jgi:hypothetical protein